MNQNIEIDVDDITIDFGLYPRRGGINNEIVEQYRNSIDKLPPIVVQEVDKILIDGFHRLQAHILEGKKTIKAEALDIPKDKILIESIKRNNTHGYQLSKDDKQRLARELWKQMDGKPVDKKRELTELFSVSAKTISNWTNDLAKEEEKVENEKILELYLRCYTTREIGEELCISNKTVDNRIEAMCKNGNFSKITHEPPQSLRIYDVWQFSNCDDRYGSNYPGRIPGQIIESFIESRK